MDLDERGIDAPMRLDAFGALRVPHDHALVRDAPFELEDGRDEIGNSLSSGFSSAKSTPWGGMEAGIGHRIEPLWQLSAQIVDVTERASGEKTCSRT